MRVPCGSLTLKNSVRVLGRVLTTIRNTERNSWQFFLVMTGDVKPSFQRQGLFLSMKSRIQTTCWDWESVGTSLHIRVEAFWSFEILAKLFPLHHFWIPLPLQFHASYRTYEMVKRLKCPVKFYFQYKISSHDIIWNVLAKSKWLCIGWNAKLLKFILI